MSYKNIDIGEHLALVKKENEYNINTCAIPRIENNYAHLLYHRM